METPRSQEPRVKKGAKLPSCSCKAKELHFESLFTVTAGFCISSCVTDCFSSGLGIVNGLTRSS